MSYRWSISTIEEVKDEVHDELENTNPELQKNSEVNRERIDESNELLSEDLKIENEWQYEISNPSLGLLVLCKGLLMCPPTMQT